MNINPKLFHALNTYVLIVDDLIGTDEKDKIGTFEETLDELINLESITEEEKNEFLELLQLTF